MAAVVKIVPKEEWRIMSKYLANEGVILVPENVFDDLPEKERALIMDAVNGSNAKLNSACQKYDFGGEADFMVDVIRDKNAYFLGCARDSEEDVSCTSA